MTISVWQDRSAEGDSAEADVVVVGAGISGAACAWALGARGARVVLVDRAHVAAGASGRNAGFSTVGSVAFFGRLVERWGVQGALDLRRRLKACVERVDALVAETGIACGLTRPGSLSLATTAGGLAALAGAGAILEDAGLELEPWDADRLAADAGLHGFAGALRDPLDGQLDPVALVEGLVARSGARVLTGEEVVRVDAGPDGVEVHTRLRRLRADHAVLALNGYAPRLDPWLARHVRPRRGQALLTGPVPVALPGPCYATEDWVYFRQLADGRLVVGGHRRLDPEGEVGTEDVLSPRIQAALEAFVRRHLPAAADVPVLRRWTGVLGYTDDGLPLLGPLPGRPRVHALLGYSGHGMAWGVHAAELVVDHLAGGVPVPDGLAAARLGP